MEVEVEEKRLNATLALQREDLALKREDIAIKHEETRRDLNIKSRRLTMQFCGFIGSMVVAFGLWSNVQNSIERPKQNSGLSAVSILNATTFLSQIVDLWAKITAINILQQIVRNFRR